MPKIVNGHDSNPDYALASKMLADIKAFWAAQQAELVGEDPMRVSRLATVAFSQWAAMLAVDVGMQSYQFSAVCQANFDEAFKQAPRFG